MGQCDNQQTILAGSALTNPIYWGEEGGSNGGHVIAVPATCGATVEIALFNAKINSLKYGGMQAGTTGTVDMACYVYGYEA